MAPLFEHYGVRLWTPEVGGRIDRGAEDHEQTMLALGLQSKREIARTRIRVRTAMATQTREQGRDLGGRPPYGYRLADAGPHPNKVHASGVAGRQPFWSGTAVSGNVQEDSASEQGRDGLCAQDLETAAALGFGCIVAAVKAAVDADVAECVDVRGGVCAHGDQLVGAAETALSHRVAVAPQQRHLERFVMRAVRRAHLDGVRQVDHPGAGQRSGEVSREDLARPHDRMSRASSQAKASDEAGFWPVWRRPSRTMCGAKTESPLLYAPPTPRRACSTVRA